MSREPDETQAMPVLHATLPILEGILNDVRGDLSRLVHHRRYHQDQSTASATIAMPVITATEAPRMSFADIENEIKTLAAHAKRIEEEVLPVAAEGLKKLEGLAGNPVVLSLLAAVHVPVEALPMAVKVIDGLEELYKPDTAVSAPSEPVAPAAVAAEPVAAPVAG